MFSATLPAISELNFTGQFDIHADILPSQQDFTGVIRQTSSASLHDCHIGWVHLSIRKKD